jgi:hypothetical protein
MNMEQVDMKDPDQEGKCPICGGKVVFQERYPNALCANCMASAVDKDERHLNFYNTHISGGLAGEYIDTEEPYFEDHCFVNGIRCLVEERYLGGIVMQPHTEENNSVPENRMQ